MKKTVVVLDFIRIPVPEKFGRGLNVTESMTGNPNFPSPDVPLADLTEATTLLETSYVAGLSGDRQKKAVMHRAEAAWNQLMRDQAKYVDRIAKGDRAIILSAGFNVSKQPDPRKRPEFSVVRGEKPGSVILHCKAMQEAYSYVWQYCKVTLAETETEWTFGNATGKATATLYNLTPSLKYWFRVAPVLADETGAFCEPIMLIMS